MLPLARTGLTAPAVAGRGLSEGLGLTASTQHRLLRTKGLRSLAVPGKAALSVRVDDLVKREVCLGVVPKR